MGCVYMATNRVNGKRYIGKTVRTLCSRLYNHKSVAKCNNGHCFSSALRKYGCDNFEWTILFEGTNNKELCRVEMAMIAMLHTKTPKGYNLTNGGEGNTGWHPSTDTLAKQSVSHKGRAITAEQRAKISASLKASKVFQASLDKLHASNVGRPVSVEHRNKIAKAHKGRVYSADTIAKMSAAQKQRFSKPGARVGTPSM